jgi:Icc-related predicted phosphoesterase
MKETIIMGDIHGRWGPVNIFLNKKHEEVGLILQCGDFGHWPKFHGKTYINSLGRRYTEDNYGLKNWNIPFYFCDGNHEDHPALREGDIKWTEKNVHYMKRGSVLTLEDGRNVLFIGGAKSIDKKYRIAGDTWFPEESISEKEMYELPDVKIDIVISHTAPRKFPITYDRVGFDTAGFNDDNRDKLDYVLNKYKPKLWFFGHVHKYQTGFTKNCKWTALDMVGGGGKWYTTLPY